jgi:hypothetical protein
MVESPENLVLAELLAIRADLADVQGSLGEVKRQLGSVESSQALVLRLTVQLVERRLDLRDA